LQALALVANPRLWLQQNVKERKHRKKFFLNQIKIKWRIKKLIESRRVLEALCLENDKKKKKTTLCLSRNGRNQETKGNCNEKLQIKENEDR
jgi:hypothetical protein